MTTDVIAEERTSPAVKLSARHASSMMRLLPAMMPPPSWRPARENTVRSTLHGSAPSATRIPISRVRRATATAQILAGITPNPSDPALKKFVENDAFKEHQQWMTQSWN